MTCRKHCTLFIVLCIALMMLLSTAIAIAEGGTAGDDITWSLDTDGILTITGSGKMDKSASWSSYRRDITEVVIGDGITTLSDDAFYGCDEIASVSLPSTLTKIGDRAFYGCKELTSITIPAAVTKIGDYAFSNTGLTFAVIQEGATEIQADEFYGCDKLTSVSIPDSVTAIGDRAFYGCKKLTELSIPVGVTKIGDYAFSNTGLETVVLEEGITEIWADAFYGCDKLKNVSIPSTVTEIGDRAFYGCKKLTRIVIPASVEEVGDYAFSSTGLKDVVFIDGIEEIVDEMFYGCDKIERVLIPASVEEIGDTAFYGCKNLNTIYFTGTEKDWMSIEIGDYNDPLNKAVKICNYEGNDFPEEEETQASNPVSTQTPSTSDAVAETTVNNEKPDFSDGDFVDGGTDGSITWEFYSNGLLMLSGTGDIPDDGAWRSHRSSINAVVIDEGISEIGENAFRSYESLDTIYIPNTITEIGDRAFYYCSSLESITIPGSVETMGEFIFYGSALKNAAFEEGVTVISENCFRGSEYLENVILPDTITTIEDRAFYVCTSLKEIIIPNSVTSWGEYIFYGSGLETVTFRDGLQMIGENAFRGAEELKTVNLPNTLTEIKDRAFYVTESLEEITLPASLEKMGEFVFYGSGLKKVVFAEKTTTVFEGAFRGCEDIEEVHLANTITEIEDRAFYACKELESIVIPASIKELGDYVFYGTGLETIYYCGSQADWKNLKTRNNSEIDKAQIVFDYVPTTEDESNVETIIDSVTPYDESNQAEVDSEVVKASNGQDYNEWECPNCGGNATGNFCSNCGNPKPAADNNEDTVEQDESTSEVVEVKLASGRKVTIRKSVKEAIDAYESFMDSYYAAMNSLGDGDFTEYMAFMDQYSETVEKMEDMEDDLTEEESLYYLEVSTRILEKAYN